MQLISFFILVDQISYIYLKKTMNTDIKTTKDSITIHVKKEDGMFFYLLKQFA